MKIATATKPEATRSGRRRHMVRVALVEPNVLLRVILAKMFETEASIDLAGKFDMPTVTLEAVLECTPDVIVANGSSRLADDLAKLERAGRARVILLDEQDAANRTGFPSSDRGHRIIIPSLRDTLILQKRGAEILAAVDRVSTARLSSRLLPDLKPAARTVARRDFAPLEETDPIVIIGASTGGPKALGEVIGNLEPNLHARIVIVQHMPRGFTAGLAHRLTENSSYLVEEAEEGEVLQRGKILVAPGDRHLTFGRGYRVHLDEGPRLLGVRPSIDKTMLSAVKPFGSRLIAVVLTGMGSDGAGGAEAIGEACGWVMAEDESTATVFGMPKAVVKTGTVNAVLPLRSMAGSIAHRISREGRRS